ncbi:hypothetical protein IIB50_00615 [Patescibacteria group bacterium]|nr:hypothetical protein [Patescibacteria group bacterium]
MNKTVLTLVVIAVALLGGYYVFTTSPAGDGQVANVASVLTQDNDVYAEDQLAGSTVVVRGVKLSAPGYVVIHLVAQDGSAGDIVGNSELLSEGITENVSVNLAGVSEVGDAFVAMLHSDNGDGVFNTEEDAPTVDGTEIVVMQFDIVAEIAEATEVDEVTDDGNEVVKDGDVVEDDSVTEEEKTIE